MKWGIVNNLVVSVTFQKVKNTLNNTCGFKQRCSFGVAAPEK